MSDTQRAGLLQWLEEITPDDEDRREAVRPVMLCVRQADNTLNLGGLRLSTIPPVVSEMHGLLSLHLPHNRLTEFPVALTQHDGLFLLDMTGKRIPLLPQDPRALDELSRERCLNPALRFDGPNIILQH